MDDIRNKRGQKQSVEDLEEGETFEVQFLRQKVLNNLYYALHRPAFEIWLLKEKF